MHRYCLSLALAICLTLPLQAQARTIQDTLAQYLQELQTITAQHQSLWNKDLYAPLLLADPKTRQVYASHPDAEGRLRQQGSLYTGTLPAEVNLANTALPWAGHRWAMVLLPLPQDPHERLNLLTHELFHRAQPELGFQPTEPQCNHLDQPDGRIWLRLELAALQQAVSAKQPKKQLQHLRHALLFRQYRYQLYPAADSAENLLELNEGLAEYTGLLMSGRSRGETVKHLQEKQQAFLQDPTFTRSFAYHTLPAYGYLLQQTHPQWHRQLSPASNLTATLQKRFALSAAAPASLGQTVAQLAPQYNGQTIRQEEAAREQQRQQRLAQYRSRFMEQPHLDVPFGQMQISFDPRNIVPLDGRGTVYPTLRVSDNWGILTVEDGALVSAGWDKVTLSAPTSLSTAQARGEGWQLELKAGYTIQPVPGSEHFVLRKE